MMERLGISRNAMITLVCGILLTVLAFAGSRELWRVHLSGIILGAGIIMVAVDRAEARR